MPWLESHVYVAAWLSPLVALVGLIFVKPSNQGATPWSKRMVYVGFLTALAAVLTPLIDDTARLFSGFIVAATLWFIIWDATQGR